MFSFEEYMEMRQFLADFACITVKLHNINLTLILGAILSVINSFYKIKSCYINTP